MTPQHAWDARDAMIAHAREFHALGYMLGTAGNLSVREGEGFWITASGCDKGLLTRADFVFMGLDGTVLDRGRDDAKPSAETSIHLAVYAAYPDERVCYHVHTVQATLCARMARAGVLDLPPVEMLKGFRVWDEHPRASIAVIPNHVDVPQIARDLAQLLARQPFDIPLFLIRDHGLTVWGHSPGSARNRVELAQYIFDYMVRGRQLGLDIMAD